MQSKSRTIDVTENTQTARAETQANISMCVRVCSCVLGVKATKLIGLLMLIVTSCRSGCQKYLNNISTTGYKLIN